MKDKSFALGSIVAAFVASLCCLGPLVLGTAGLGAALTVSFAPLRPYFLVLSALLLLVGFYFAYRKPRAGEACEGEVCAPESRTRRLAKPLLWLATLVVLALAFFPQYGPKLVRASKAPAPAAVASLQTAKLKIDGMSCSVCASLVQKKLLETPGVEQARVEYPAGRATVQYDPGKTGPAQLVEAVNSTGYKASLAR